MKEKSSRCLAVGVLRAEAHGGRCHGRGLRRWHPDPEQRGMIRGEVCLRKITLGLANTACFVVSAANDRTQNHRWPLTCVEGALEKSGASAQVNYKRQLETARKPYGTLTYSTLLNKD